MFGSRRAWRKLEFDTAVLAFVGIIDESDMSRPEKMIAYARGMVYNHDENGSRLCMSMEEDKSGDSEFVTRAFAIGLRRRPRERRQLPIRWNAMSETCSAAKLFRFINTPHTDPPQPQTFLPSWPRDAEKWVRWSKPLGGAMFVECLLVGMGL